MPRSVIRIALVKLLEKLRRSSKRSDKGEPWVNFSNANEEIDYVIILRQDKEERVHIYRRKDGSFGCRNYLWIKEDPYYEGWTIGNDGGHFYDSVATALREARGRYPWLNDLVG